MIDWCRQQIYIPFHGQKKGFRNWKKPERISMNENSPKRLHSFTIWKEAEKRLKGGSMDAQLQDQIASEKERWWQVLHRIQHCIRFWPTEIWRWEGTEKTLLNKECQNAGNFKGLLKLIAKFDLLVQNHLEYAQKNWRPASYLSAEVRNEFIQLLGSTVRNKLLSDIKTAKYYGLIFDSTSDAAHREQMS